MAFVLNNWYVAAWPEEVTRDKILARTICGRAMILFRDAQGKAVGLEDRCCHREAPLSLGWMEPDATVRCGYHGMRFDGSGACVEIPGRSTIPPSARVDTWPVHEKHGWIWVWPGDPELADPALIPAGMARNDMDGWTSVGSTCYVKGHYQLIVDNLMDLTHVTFVHQGTLGDPVVLDNPLDVRNDDISVTAERWMINHDPSPFWKRNLNRKLGKDVMADRWQIIRFEAPSFVMLDNGAAPTGLDVREHPERRSEGVESCSLNAITPETEDTSWYFWAFSRRFLRDDDTFSETLRKEIAAVFDQDRVLVEGTHQVMKRNPGRTVIHLQADKAQNIARRMVKKRLDEEAISKQKQEAVG